MAAQNMPLPAGWEAKYDAAQRRYFFIDHATKETTWEDPRIALMKQQQQQQQQQQQRHQPSPNVHRPQHQPSPHLAAQSHHQHASRGSSPHTSRASGANSNENIAMTDMNQPKWQRDVESKFDIQVSTMGHHDDEEDHEPHSNSETSFSSNVDPQKLQTLKRMFPTAEEWAVRNALAKAKNIEGLAIANLEAAGYHRQNVYSQQKEANIVNKLQKEFPSAEIGMVRDVVQCVDQNEARARQELKALGYEPSVAPKQPDQMRSSPARVSPAKQAAKKSESPPKQPQITEHAKKALKASLKAEFSDYSDNMIDIALDSCQYNKDRARQLLTNMRATRKEAETRKKSSERSMSPASRETGSSSSSRAATATPSSVNLNLPDFTLSPTTITTSSSVIGSKKNSRSVTSHTSRTSRSVTKPKQKTRSAGHSSQAQHTVPVTSTGKFTSANRTGPIGPDASLATGPDKNLLMKEYQPISGPDITLTNGPNMDLANGPDPSLHQGAAEVYKERRRSMCENVMASVCGANPELRQGTIYQANRMPLITSV